MDPVVESMLDARGRPRVQTINTLPSKTIQSQADQADIKKILKKYRQVGIVDHLNDVKGRFMDVSEFTDLGDALRQVKVVEAEFMKLPSKVREVFNHDVAEYLDTAHDPEKRQALIDAGVLEAPAAPPAADEAPVEPVPAPPPAE